MWLGKTLMVSTAMALFMLLAPAFGQETWSGWSEVPGGGTTLVSDAATAYGDGKLYLFGIGVNNHRHYVNTFDGANWSGWSEVLGGGTTAVSDAVTGYADGKLYLFGIGIIDHRHYVNTLCCSQIQ